MKYLLSPFHSNVPSFLPHVTPFTFYPLPSATLMHAHPFFLPHVPPFYLLSPPHVSPFTFFLPYHPLPSISLRSCTFYLTLMYHPLPSISFHPPSCITLYLLSPSTHPHVSPFTFYLLPPTLMYHPLPSISFHPPSCITLYLLSPSTHPHVSPFTFYLLPPTLMYHPLPSISFHPPSCITLYLLSPSTHPHVSPFTLILSPTYLPSPSTAFNDLRTSETSLTEHILEFDHVVHVHSTQRRSMLCRRRNKRESYEYV